MFSEADLMYTGFIALLFAVSVAAGATVGRIIIGIARRITGKTKTTLDDKVLDAITTPLESFAFIVVFYFLIEFFPDLSAAATLVRTYVWAAIVVVATYMASEASGAVLRWYYGEGHKTSRIKIDLTLMPLIRRVSKIVIYFVGLTIALGAAGFDITGLLAVTSIAGIILGLASQETLGNIFAGMALQLDRPFRYGDYIRFATGEVARVRRVGLRSTMLEDLSHSTIIMSNSELAKQRITNLNHPDDELRMSFPVEVPIGTDLEALEAYLHREISANKFEGFVAEQKVGVFAERIRQNSIEILVSYSVRGFPNAGRIRDFANRRIIEFSSAAGKKRKK
jgi:small-conductance mechanosensitive channel